MSKFKKEELRNFIRDGAGEYPPVFVGRDTILSDVLDMSNRARERGYASPKNTHIIQGAPGAGKTSILKALELRGQCEGQPRTIFCSNVEVEDHLPDVLQSIAAAVKATDHRWIELVHSYGSNLGKRMGGVKAFGFDVDIEKLFSKTPLQDLHTLGKSLPAPKWERPVILAIDEFQRIKGNQETPLAKFLQSIHDADHIRLPLTLVLAGLSDTRECARKMGLTNTVNVCSVGRFTQEEQNEAVVGFCDHFGIDVGFQKDRLHTYFSVSDGWPRHIYWAQQALAEILITSEVEGCLECIQDWASVENRRDFLRVAYYEDRTSFEMESSRKILGAVMTFVENMEKNGTQLFLSDIEEILYRTFRNGESKPWKLPDGYNSQSYVRHLIHQGALQRDHITKSYVCPIPSFQSYLIEQADFTSEEWEELCEMRGNESKVS